LPRRLAGLRFVGLSGKADPLFTVRVLVPRAVTNDDADAREFEIHESLERVLLVAAKLEAADHAVVLFPPDAARARASA